MKTVTDVLHWYLKNHVRVKCVDWRRQHQIAANLRAGLANLDVAALDSEILNGYQEKRRSGAVGTKPARSDGTLRRELGTLTAAINFAIADRKLDRSAAPVVRLPDKPPPRDLWLDEAELEQLLAAAASVRDRGLVGWRGWLFTLIAAETASRRHAIETLRWTQVDLQARLIHFQAAGRAASKKRRVPVPISDRLLPALQAAHAARRGDFVLGSGSECAKAFAVVCAEAYARTRNGKFLDLHPHALRRTWATQAARAGVDLYAIAGVLGDSMQVVTSNYICHAPGHLRAAVNFRA